MRKFSILFILTFITGTLFAQMNQKPFVVPELQSWKGSTGHFNLTSDAKIICNNPDAFDYATRFAEDLKKIADLDIEVVTKQKAKAGDIVITAKKPSSKNEEAYFININNTIEIGANNPIGINWAAQTLLQMTEQSDNHKLPKGKIVDYPAYPLRGFMLDCGRKFFTLDFLKQYVRFMSYYKMNTFQIHLNDNGFKQFWGDNWDNTYAAFRLESETYPGLTAKDGSYTKQEFKDLQKLAESYGVLIIPEIDAPAHVLAFTHYMPEIGSKEYGMDHFDLFNPKTYEFMDGLFKEYLEGDDPVFRGKYVHIGTDEYSNKNKEVVEKFRYFTDRYINYIESFGKQAALWGALTHAKGETPVKVDSVLMLCWYNGYADPQEMKKLGYEMVSIPDGLVYIVPKAGYYYDYLNNKHLYENWTPAVIGNQVFDENDPQIKGGMFAVWNDHVGNGISQKDVHHRVLPSMKTLSTKMWKGKKTGADFDTFTAKSKLIGEAPGVNIMGTYKEKGEILRLDSIAANSETPLKEIGYDYFVEFDLYSKDNKNGAVLFESPDAVVYLRDPETGKVGFSRDGYNYTFNYVIPNDKTLTLAFEGNNVSTKFYVNGHLIETLEVVPVYKDQQEKAKFNYNQTLVFPLQKTGDFKGYMKNLKVINK
ncbi:MAG: family 20 glycosylhydrolase [Bacteroidales bacterium]